MAHRLAARAAPLRVPRCVTTLVVARRGSPMPGFSTRLHVAAPPARTFAAFTDFEHASENIRGIARLVVQTPGPLRVGTRFEETRVMWGREASVVMEIREWEPGRAYAFGCEE